LYLLFLKEVSWFRTADFENFVQVAKGIVSFSLLAFHFGDQPPTDDLLAPDASLSLDVHGAT